MLSESQVPIEHRYLMLHTRVSARRFAEEKAAAIDWCSKNSKRLTESTRAALAELQGVEVGGTVCAFLQCYCYADIPPGRTYSALFSLAEPNIGSQTVARLRLAIFWGKLPILNLEHGHHHLVVFEFQATVPDIVNILPIDLFDGGRSRSHPELGLCDLDTWNEVRNHGRDA